MKVVHAYKIYLPDIAGGIPAAIESLCRIAGRYENEIVVARGFGWTRKFLQDRTPVIASLSFGNLFSMPMAPTFVAQLAKRVTSADILVHHMPFPLADLAILNRLPRRVGLVVFFHADVVNRPLLRRLVAPLIRYSLRKADRIVISDESIARSSCFLAPHLSKLAIIPYGVDTHYWSEVTANQQIEIDHRRAKHPRLLVAIGRLVPYKGYDVLLRAMLDIAGELVIIGDGPLRTTLERMAIDLGISDRVKFAGGLKRDEVKIWLHSAQVYALSSRTSAEAFGIVQIEAMAAGLPVVNTNLNTAVPAVARNGIEALTVPPEDPAQFARAVNHLLDSPDFARRLGAAGRVRAQAEFDEQVFLERMTAVYDGVIRHHSAEHDN